MEVLETVTFAFQPIVNPQSGYIFGYEALLRNYKQAGFSSIQAVFDSAYAEGMLAEFDEWLRLKVIGIFLTSGFHPSTKLFYNIDNRLFANPEYSSSNFAKKLEDTGFPKDSFYIEISERHNVDVNIHTRKFIATHRQNFIRIALDDFGVGYSGLQLLYDMDPDVIKLDRYFIAGIDKDPKKRLFVQHIVEMAHVLGIQVVAEGIETDTEFYSCREIGFDFVQGFLIQAPRIIPFDNPTGDSELVCNIIRSDKRSKSSIPELIIQQMQNFPSFSIEEPIEHILLFFKNYRDSSYVPILTRQGEPLGIVRETDFKTYLYTPFGYDLLKNKNLCIKSFIKKVPVLDFHSRLEKFLEVYALSENAETLLLTDKGKYLGCLSQGALLQLIHDKEVQDARDQNPLSRLRGNLLINDYLLQSLSNPFFHGFFAYFDFNCFKPYNDLYGFRQGDRVIMLFADLLREQEQMYGWFIGHIGGDDFFAGIPFEYSSEQTLKHVNSLCKRFKQDVAAFYEPVDRSKGYIRGKDRNGRTRRFPLLGVSAALIGINSYSPGRTLNDVSKILSILKAEAKVSSQGIVLRWLEDLEEKGKAKTLVSANRA